MKKLVLPLAGLLIIAGITAVVATKKMSDKKAAELNASIETTPSTASPKPDTPIQTVPAPQAALAQGRYEVYETEKVAATGYENTVLFFYAGWCPECRSFKQAINTSGVPNGTQVLEVNYDTASDLKKQYGITLQSTFVKVDDQGNQLAKWVGYGKEKSLQAVLGNLK